MNIIFELVWDAIVWMLFHTLTFVAWVKGMF